MGYLYNNKGAALGEFRSSMIFTPSGEYIGCLIGNVIYRVVEGKQHQVGYIKGQRIYRGLSGAASMVGSVEGNLIYRGFGVYRKTIARFSDVDGSTDIDIKEAAAAALLICDFHDDTAVPKDSLFRTIRQVSSDTVGSTLSAMLNGSIYIGRKVTGGVAPYFTSMVGVMAMVGMITILAVLYYLYLGIHLYLSLYIKIGFWLMAVAQLVSAVGCVIQAIKNGDEDNIKWILLLLPPIFIGTAYIYGISIESMQLPTAVSFIEWWQQLYPFMLYGLWMGLFSGIIYQYYPRVRSLILPGISTVISACFSIVFIVFYDLRVPRGLLFGISYLAINIWTVLVLMIPGMMLTYVMAESRQSIPFGVPVEFDLYGKGDSGIPNNISKLLAHAEELRDRYIRILSFQNLTSENRIKHLKQMANPVLELTGTYTEGRGLIEEVGDDYLILRVNFPYKTRSSANIIRLVPVNTLTMDQKEELIGSFANYRGIVSIHRLDLLTPIHLWDFVVARAEITKIIATKKSISNI